MNLKRTVKGWVNIRHDDWVRIRDWFRVSVKSCLLLELGSGVRVEVRVSFRLTVSCE